MRPSAPPPPPWSSGDAVPAGPGGPATGTPGQTSRPLGADRGVPPMSPDFFEDALDAAMALVPADSGELATLDDSRQRLVLRARRTRPRLEPGRGAYAPGAGIPGRQSQPLHGGGMAGAPDPLAAIEQETTNLLPGVLLSRSYAPGERLIGFTWQHGAPVVMRDDECRRLRGGAAPADPEAAWHLAVPIHRPGPFRGSRAGRQIIGVLAVHNRDSQWSFSAQDVELLSLHADRVACTMKADELARLNVSQSAMLEFIRAAEGAGIEQPNLGRRVRDIVCQLIDAPDFAFLVYQAKADELACAVAQRNGQPLAPPPIPAGAAPRWWSAVRAGHVVCVSAPEDRAAHPEYCLLGWGGDEPVASLLAAPLVVDKVVTGAIVAGSPNADAYAPEHARLFESIARSASVVWENRGLAERLGRSLQQARAKAEQLAVLNDAVLTLNYSLDLDETLRALVRQAKGLTTAQVCVVFLRDDANKTLVAQATNLDAPEVRGASSQPGAVGSGSLPVPSALLGVRIPLGWRNLDHVLANQHYWLPDDLDAEWQQDTPLGRMLYAERIQQALVLPVAAQGKQVGALWVYTPGQHHRFPPEEIGLLQGLAGQAAVAIANARLYQELERAYEQQKELDRYKDEFILTVSHEFRTPLTAIEGYMTLIKRHGERLPQDKLEQFAQEIRLATNQLANMINMLVDANRMSSQPLQLDLRAVRVQEVAETACRQLPPESQPRVRTLVPPNLWVDADPDRLAQVLSNLLSNALKYSPATAGCELGARVETREALARAGRPHAAAPGAPERWVVIQVVDHGEGISPEDQAHLFQKFVRLSRSLVTSVRGTGLGLWICRQYVDAMHGDIWVESAVGQGSTFRFALPAADPPPAS